MKKLFVCIIIVLLSIQSIGCTQGLFIGETIISTQPQEIIKEEGKDNEESPIIQPPVEENLTEDNLNEEDIKDQQHANEETANEENDGQNDGQDQETANMVVAQFNTTLPPSIKKDLKYDRYQIGYDYLLILNTANVREGPGLDKKVIHTFQANEKVALISEVKGEYLEKWGSDSWYQVKWEEGEEVKTGFIYGVLGEARCYRFEKMEEAIRNLQEESIKGELAYINNYKDVNGIPPLFNGKSKDNFGYRRSQSAPGYDKPSTGANFRYIPDGMLVLVLEEKRGFSKVKVIGWEGEYWVQKKYINSKNPLKELKKVIVVDRAFQNQGAFELVEGQWTLVSYSLATTGKQGTYSLETPLGYYMAIQKRDKFLYYKDGTNQIAGYAPYAIRFSGGGYIHGVPVDYVIKDGRRIDPGIKESVNTLGTIPRSHMCVRNYTSHAQFLYDWADIGYSAVIVIE